jgi:septal ring factor EnvC (AmiA/AmiB activator)
MQRRHILSEEEIGALKMKLKEAQDREEQMQKNINVMKEEIQRLKE